MVACSAQYFAMMLRAVKSYVVHSNHVIVRLISSGFNIQRSIANSPLSLAPYVHHDDDVLVTGQKLLGSFFKDGYTPMRYLKNGQYLIDMKFAHVPATTAIECNLKTPELIELEKSIQIVRKPVIHFIANSASGKTSTILGLSQSYYVMYVVCDSGELLESVHIKVGDNLFSQMQKSIRQNPTATRSIMRADMCARLQLLRKYLSDEPNPTPLGFMKLQIDERGNMYKIDCFKLFETQTHEEMYATEKELTKDINRLLSVKGQNQHIVLAIDDTERIISPLCHNVYQWNTHNNNTEYSLLNGYREAVHAFNIFSSFVIAGSNSAQIMSNEILSRRIAVDNDIRYGPLLPYLSRENILSRFAHSMDMTDVDLEDSKLLAAVNQLVGRPGLHTAVIERYITSHLVNGTSKTDILILACKSAFQEKASEISRVLRMKLDADVEGSSFESILKTAHCFAMLFPQTPPHQQLITSLCDPQVFSELVTCRMASEIMRFDTVLSVIESYPPGTPAEGQRLITFDEPIVREALRVLGAEKNRLWDATKPITRLQSRVVSGRKAEKDEVPFELYAATAAQVYHGQGTLFQLLNKCRGSTISTPLAADSAVDIDWLSHAKLAVKSIIPKPLGDALEEIRIIDDMVAYCEEEHKKGWGQLIGCLLKLTDSAGPDFAGVIPYHDPVTGCLKYYLLMLSHKTRSSKLNAAAMTKDANRTKTGCMYAAHPVEWRPVEESLLKLCENRVLRVQVVLSGCTDPSTPLITLERDDSGTVKQVHLLVDDRNCEEYFGGTESKLVS